MPRSVQRLKQIGLGLAMGIAALSNLPGCHYIEERFQTCGHLTIDLINSEQTLSAINILADGEAPMPATLLPSGGSRRISACVDRGARQKFSATTRDGQVVAQATCVVQRATSEFPSNIARVIWGPLGLDCENW